MRDIAEEDPLWEAKDRKLDKGLLQREQEPEADGSGKFAEQVAAGETGPKSSKSTSNVAKHPPRFY